MVEVHARSREANDVALVECRLTNDEAAPRRVLVESRLDGPTWPPREGDVPDPRWDGDRAEVVVGAGRTVGIGFAAPAPAREPAVAVVEAEPVPAVEIGDDLEPPEPRSGPTGGESASPQGTTAPTETTVAAVAGELTDARPPLRGVLAEEWETETDDATCDRAVPAASNGDGPHAADADVRDRPSPSTSEVEGGRSCSGIDRDRSAGRTIDQDWLEGQETGEVRPVPPDDWLDEVEARTARLEGLAAARSLPAATASVAAAGGLDTVRHGVETARTDRDRLLAFAARAQALAGRIEATDVPIGTLERLS